MIELILLAIGLAMDAFAVSITKGLCMKNKINYKQALFIAFSFGLFQAIMPLIGYTIGIQFSTYIVQFDHWIAFLLLSFIGIKMILEAVFEKEETECKLFSIKEILILSVATSIDALAVGVTLSFIQTTNIIQAIIVIGLITLIISFIGVKIGHKFGMKYEKSAEIFGGILLILIGLKILFEHLGFINF
ncbi:MAG: manganese efflux pump [Spirochaetia bacterium]|nr:manganese efflux pump [Spirochaetia bacterium]